LAWEVEHDCIGKMREWMLAEKVVDATERERLEEEDRQHVNEVRQRAWDAFIDPIRKERDGLVAEIETLSRQLGDPSPIETIVDELRRKPSPARRDLMRAVADVLLEARVVDPAVRQPLVDWRREQLEENEERYSLHLYSESEEAAIDVPHVPIAYDEQAPSERGFEIMNRFFDQTLERYPQFIAFGQDVGQLGDVNQGFAGLQEKHGELRVTDAGIREATILGQAIGLALRGLRPLAEIQYLDYLLYALQIISDDLATLRYRTRGGQKAPVIIRTRGHRLEGIWHSGSPMAGIINLVRGIYVCVPRDMTRAVGFYNTMLRSDDSALIIEVLNGYRLKEKLTEVIDVQTLVPFDVVGRIVESLRKTGRVLFVDEDVPGGATAYMMQQVIDQQHGFWSLDAQPRTVTSKAHRPAYGSDGDYWSKPNREQIFQAAYEMMHEADPESFPIFY
jgi:pyruvate/2-oxoglutarate/acetoin dehydrogenase E1 component